MATEPLTERQIRFCREYAADPNATQAYQRAFGPVAYSTARSEGCRLITTNPNIRAEIKAAREEYKRRVRVNATRVLRGVSELAFADPADAFSDGKDGGLPEPNPLGSIPPATRRAITSVKVKRRRRLVGEVEWEVQEVEYKFSDKGAAFDKLCKKLGFYADDKDGAATAGFRPVIMPAKDKPPPDECDHAL